MQNDNIRINICISLLSKPLWSNQDIMDYLGCKTTTASNIRQEAIKVGGISKLFPQRTKRDAIFKVLELDYEREIKRLKLLMED